MSHPIAEDKWKSTRPQLLRVRVLWLVDRLDVPLTFIQFFILFPFFLYCLINLTHLFCMRCIVANWSMIDDSIFVFILSIHCWIGVLAERFVNCSKKKLFFFHKSSVDFGEVLSSFQSIRELASFFTQSCTFPWVVCWCAIETARVFVLFLINFQRLSHAFSRRFNLSFFCLQGGGGCRHQSGCPSLYGANVQRACSQIWSCGSRVVGRTTSHRQKCGHVEDRGIHGGAGIRRVRGELEPSGSVHPGRTWAGIWWGGICVGSRLHLRGTDFGRILLDGGGNWSRRGAEKKEWIPVLCCWIIECLENLEQVYYAKLWLTTVHTVSLWQV